MPSCKQCGECCKTMGGAIPYDKDNVEKLQREMPLKAEMLDYFEGISVYETPVQENSERCRFLRKSSTKYICTVYSCRPEVCRKYICHKKRGAI